MRTDHVNLAKILFDKQPRNLFRYAPLDTDKRIDELKDLLTNNRLYCASPLFFNDPFELKPSFNPSFESEEFKRQYFEYGTRYAQGLFPGLYKSEEELNQLLRQRYAQLIANPEQVYAQLQRGGVSCLTENDNNLLMWAHYAAGHKGCCLKFNSPEWRTDHEVLAYEVSYDEAYPCIDAWPCYYERLKPEAEQNPEIFFEFTKSLVLRKSPAWGYEKEWRLIRPEPGFVSFNPESLEQITFGVNVPNELIEEFRNILKQRTMKVAMCKADLEKGMFSLRYVPA